MSSVTSSLPPYDGAKPISHGKSRSCRIMHNGMRLSSQVFPRPFDTAYHGKRFTLYSRNRGLYSYNPEQVSSSLIRYTKQLYNLDPKVTKMQRQVRGLRQWKRLESGEHGHLGTEDLLYLYSKCFDNLFFRGLLNGLYKILFVEPEMISGLDGCCTWSRPFEHEFETQISISNRRDREGFESLDKPAQLRKYLGTLIHEMVHAVFSLCCCVKCESCGSTYREKVGISGHSLAWQKLAMTIEDVLIQRPSP